MPWHRKPSPFHGYLKAEINLLWLQQLTLMEPLSSALYFDKQLVEI